MTINGSLFFHLNPMLCFSEIKPLFRNNVTPPEHDVSVMSNGDKAVCNIVFFNLTVEAIHHKSVVLVWPTFPDGLVDKRVLSHVVHYRKT